MSELTCLVTGASLGIGFWTAMQLSQRVGRIGLLCRNAKRANEARQAILKNNPAVSAVDVWIADVSSISLIRETAYEIRKAYESVDVLINNAGAVFGKRGRSTDGFEMHWATNYAGHFLLTALLIEPLTRSHQGRVINLSSALYAFGRIRLDDLEFARPYHLVPAYAQSKLAVATITREWARRTHHLPLTVNCIDPGYVRTAIAQGGTGHQRWLAKSSWWLAQDPAEASKNIVKLATHDQFRGISGAYYVQNRKREMAKRARDVTQAAALWSRSCGWLTETEKRVLKSATNETDT